VASHVLLTAPPIQARYTLLLTRDESDIVDAQRLRHRVFAGEMHAPLSSLVPGLDVDDLDRHCDHLIVRDEPTGEVVGTYRMLMPEQARQAGRLYAEGEFDLSGLDGLRPALVETGRSCVHPAHRSGAVVGLMWAGIARYMLLTGHDWLVGCASVPLADGGVLAAGVWGAVRDRHLAPTHLRVVPRRAWDVASAPRLERVVLPPLLRDTCGSGLGCAARRPTI
jgi:putative hemolysin